MNQAYKFDLAIIGLPLGLQFAKAGCPQIPQNEE